MLPPDRLRPPILIPAFALLIIASRPVAQAELEALGPLGERAIPGYIELIERDGIETVIAARAAQQLSRFSATQARAAVPVLLRCLGNGEPMLVDAAMRTLRLWRDAIVDDVCAVWLSGDRRARARAGTLLSAIRPDEFFVNAARSARLADDPVAFVRHAALLQRTAIGRAADAPHLVRALDDPDTHIVQAACAFLARIEPSALLASDAVPALRRCLLERNKLVLLGAAEVLARCGAAGLPTLEAALRSQDRDRGWAAIEWLHLLGADGARLAPLVSTYLDDAQREFVAGAARAIARWSFVDASPESRAKWAAAICAAAERTASRPVAELATAYAAIHAGTTVAVPKFVTDAMDSRGTDFERIEAGCFAALALSAFDLVATHVPRLLDEPHERLQVLGYALIAAMPSAATAIARSLDETLLTAAPNAAGEATRHMLRALAERLPHLDAAQRSRAAGIVVASPCWSLDEAMPVFEFLGCDAIDEVLAASRDQLDSARAARCLAAIARTDVDEVWICTQHAEPWIALAAIEAIGALGPRAAPFADRLAQLHLHATEPVASTATIALAKLGPPALPYALRALGTAEQIDTLAFDPDRATILRGLRLCAQLGTHAESTIPRLLRLLELISAHTERWGTTSGHDSLTPEIEATLTQLGASGIRALEQRAERGIDCTAYFGAALLVRDQPTRIAALRAIHRLEIDSPTIRRRLLTLGLDDDLEVRRWALLAMRDLELDDVAAQSAFCRSLGDPRAVLRQRAIEALDRLVSPLPFTLPFVLELLEDPDAEIRRLAARVLTRYGEATSAVQPALVEACADGDPQVTALLTPLVR